MNEAEQREEAVFEAALKLPAEQRAAYLDKACASDTDLRRRVEILLGAFGRAGGFMKQPAAPERTARFSLPPTEKPGDKIGRYKLLEQIGEGGCGVVYVAEQVEPVRRRVALKVIKLGMDTKSVVARFDAERQALAMMDHPNIAKIHDAGVTDTGRPYFIMELVRGIKITDYCDQNHLPARERLDLFIQVCRAVQHAHQKGIIHRDLKPSNVLVASDGGVPVPKVIDFGIAKATQGRLTDQTIYTAFEQFIGTPAYMSPEQAALSLHDIDTRSDIYSLGVLLYELLTGTTPFDAKELLAAGLDEMRRTIREVEPVKPSTRLTQAATSENRNLTSQKESAPRTGHLAIPSDLDWIVMKCLEKERARRYETANGLAADIARHLNNEPIVARPPSKLYEFQKTVQRHKFGFAAATALILVLAIGAIISTWQAVRATRAESRESTARQQAEAAQKIAQTQEMLARQRFYSAQMNLASQAWEAGLPARALDLLETLKPKLGERDLRRFEWFHLWGLCNARLRLSLRGNDADISMVLFSADMKTLAACGGDGTVRLWETASGRELIRLKSGTASGLSSIAMTPDGATLVAGTWDHRVLIWDLASGKLQATLRPQMDYIGYVAISPDGRILAFGGANGQVKLWDFLTGKEVKSLGAGPYPVNWIVFSQDGSTLITSSGWSQDRLVKVWDLATDAHKPRLELPGTRAIALSFDGRKLATLGGRPIKLWDMKTGELLTTINDYRNPPAVLAFLHDDRLVAGCLDRTIMAWKLNNAGSAIGAPEIIGTHLDAVHSLAVSSDGALLASGGLDGLVRVWGVADSQAASEERYATEFKCAKGLRTILLLPDKKSALVSTLEGTEVIDLTSGARHVVNTNALGPLALTPDGSRFASAKADGIVHLWEVSTGSLIASEQAFAPAAVPPPALAISPDGNTLAAGAFNEMPCEVKLWNIKEGLKLAQTIQVEGRGITSLSFSPDGSKLAVAVRFMEIAMLDLRTLKVKWQKRIGKGDLDRLKVAFSPDGELIATANGSGVVAIWNASDGASRAQMHGHTSVVNGMAFAPDGDTLATAGDTTVRLWDVSTGQEKVTLKRHGHQMGDVVFTRDGNALISGDSGGTIWLLRAPPFSQSDNETFLRPASP